MRQLNSFQARNWALLAALTQAPAVMGAVLNLPIWYRNTYAMVEVQIGTPAESFFLRFDTGSATTWAVDAGCGDDLCPDYSGFPRGGYNLSASSTGSPMGTYAVIEYLGGLTSGSGIEDVFSLPHQPCGLSWNQTFLAADQSSWAQNPGEGFFGLAFSSIADAGTTTVVEALMEEGHLDEPRFGLYLGDEFQDTGNAPGEGVLTLGSSLESKYAIEDTLKWVDLDAGGFPEHQLWRTNMYGVLGHTSNGATAEPLVADNSWAIFDTGSGSFVSVPGRFIDDLYASIGWNWTAVISGQHIPLCSEFNSSWSVEFQLGSPDAPVSIRMSGEEFRHPGFANSQDNCWPPFDPGWGDGLFLFGSRFLKRFYSIFDFGAFEVSDYKPRVGFAHLKDEWRPEVV